MQCIRCNKKGLFLRVNDDGLCKKCEIDVAQERALARAAAVERCTSYYELLCNEYSKIGGNYLYPHADDFTIQELTDICKSCDVLCSELPKWDTYELFEEIYLNDVQQASNSSPMLFNPKLPLGYFSKYSPPKFSESIPELIKKIRNLSIDYSYAIIMRKEASRKKAMGVESQNYVVVGTQYHEKDITKLGTPNPDYNMTKRDIIDCCMTDEFIWKFSFNPISVQLVPEPTNPHDSNAIKVVIDGSHVGYIRARECNLLHGLIENNRIHNINASITGGPYKSVNEDYNDSGKEVYTLERGSDDYSIELEIETTP